MRCPKCNKFKTAVTDSRMRADGASITRRRRCPSCSFRFSTTEVQTVSSSGGVFLMMRLEHHIDDLRVQFSKDLQEISRVQDTPEQVEDGIKQRLLARASH